MNPTASLVNIKYSIEKFLWDNLANPLNELLINGDDLATRLQELENRGQAIVWQLGVGFGSKFCTQALFVGSTYFADPGGLQSLVLVDKVKELLDTAASIPVYRYVDGATAGFPDQVIVPVGDPVNQLVLVGDVRFWPTVTEPNGFKTKQVSVNLRYGQVTT